MISNAPRRIPWYRHFPHIHVRHEPFEPSVDTDHSALVMFRKRALNRAKKYLGLDYATYLLKKFRRRSVTLYALLVSEILSVIIIEPFLYHLVSNPDERYAVKGVILKELAIGVVIASLYLGQAVSSSLLGHASDLHGRKPFLITGIIAAYLGVAFMGLAHVWFVALVIRFAQGLCGSVLAITKASLADIGQQDTQIHTISLIAYTTTAITFARILAPFFQATFHTFYIHFLSRFNEYVVFCVFGAILAAPSVIAVCLIKDSNSERTRADNLLPVDQDLQLVEEFGYTISMNNILNNSQMLVLITLFSLNTAAITLSTREIMDRAVGNVSMFGLEMNTWAIVGCIAWFCIGIILWQILLFKKLTEWYDLKSLYLLGNAAALFFVILGSILPLPYWINGMNKDGRTMGFVLLIIFVWTLPAILSFMLLMPTLNAMMHIITLKSQGIVFGTAQSFASVFQVISLILSSVMVGIGKKFHFPWISSILAVCILIVSLVLAILALKNQSPHKHHSHIEKKTYDTLSAFDRYRYAESSRKSAVEVMDTGIMISSP